MHIAHLEQPNFALRALPGLIGGPTLGIRIVLAGPSLYSRVILILAAVFLLYLLLRWFSRLPPQQATGIIRRTLFGLALGVLILLAATGRLHWFFALAASAIPLLRRWLPLLLRNLPFFSGLYRHYKADRATRPPPSGQRSEIETVYLRMYLDHDNGQMSGEVLAGRFKDTQLGEMELDQLLLLLEECQAEDSDSVALLETYLDREHGDQWREHQTSSQAGQGASPEIREMSQKEAYEILGLELGANKDEIIATHRRLMQRLHPDRGGSDWLAAKLNQAKDLLLNQ